jgi:Zn-dependent metalloprotease
MPAELLPEEFEIRIGKKEALAKARHSLPKLGTHVSTSKPKQVWFPYRDKLQPAWKFRIRREKPSGDWLVYVNAKTGGILSRYDNLSESRTGSGLVFDPSPITLLGDYSSLLLKKRKVRRPPAETYRQVPLQGLDGNGYLSGEHVSTKPTGKRRIRRSDSQFLLRSHEHGFEEVMVYYHVDASLRYLEKLGYSGDRTIFKSPVLANVNGVPDDNSWYSPTDKMLTFGTGEIDDAEDGETILHELGHAIQDAICHDFGQSPESGAMGEGFGDYWAASFFESKKPERYRASVMTWDGLFIGLDEGSKPPSLRRVDGKRTYKGFDKHGDVHDNGEIWSAVLWDVRRELGREVADRVIIESHFQQDGFTNFVRGARAIIDADRNLEAGRHEAALRRIFTRRKIGPL